MSNYIKIAFCIDDNLYNQLLCAIHSLLNNKKEKNIHYDIYCVYSGTSKNYANKLYNFIKELDSESNLYYFNVTNIFQNSYEIRGITSAAYLRLQLPSILKDVDKIIYSDVDVIFNDNLKEIWDLDIKEKLLGGIIGTNNLNKFWERNLKELSYWNKMIKNQYIWSGFLLMNLKTFDSSVDHFFCCIY